MTKMPLAKWKQHDARILDALHKRAIENKKRPTMGFREIRRTIKMGTDTLSRRLRILTENGYVATTTIGKYKRYYITEEGIADNESLQEIELVAYKKSKLTRLGSAPGPTATVYFKNVSFTKLESVILPAWNTFVSAVRKELKDKNCEIGFVGTMKRFQNKPQRPRR